MNQLIRENGNIEPRDSDPQKPGPSSPSPDPQFEDEPPGSYLMELVPGAGNAVWGGLNLALTTAVAVAWFSVPLEPTSPWWPSCRVAWALLPVSSFLAVVVTAWQSVISEEHSRRPRGRLALKLSLAALAAWLVLRYAAGVHFPAAPEG